MNNMNNRNDKSGQRIYLTRNVFIMRVYNILRSRCICM